MAKKISPVVIPGAPPLDWSTEAIVSRRDRFYSASQRAFVPYKSPLIIKEGRGQYVWDEPGSATSTCWR